MRDTVRCVGLAVANPPARGERVKIFNQATETHRVIDLAHLVARLTGAEVRHFMRIRATKQPENDLVIENEGFLKLGIGP
jgi:UDP-sulfoquinovose synthase